MEKKRTSIKYLPMVIGLSIGVSVALLGQYIFFSPSYQQELKRAAGEISKSCPVMVDEETRLDKVEVSGENVLKYQYTLINMTKATVDVHELEESVSPHILEDVQTNPQMAINREHNTTMVYSYQDKNKEFLFEVTITPEMYSTKKE